MMTILDDQLPDVGQLALVNLDPRVGREQSGHRPCLILTRSIYHARSAYMVICPITTNLAPYPFKVFLPDGLSVKGAILTDQVKSIDRSARGCKIIGSVPNETLLEVRGKIASLIGIAPLLGIAPP